MLNTSHLGQQPTPVPTTVRSSYFSAHLSWSKSQRSYNDLYNVSSHGLSDLISVYSLPCLLSSATWTLCSFLNVPGKLLPQGLSTCLRAFAPVNTTKSLSPPDIHMAHSLPHLLPIFAEMSLSQWDFPTTLFKTDLSRTSLVVQWLGIHLAMQRMRVWSQVRELRSYTSRATEEPTYCNYWALVPQLRHNAVK